MAKNSLDAFAERIGPAWGPLNSDLVAGCRARIEELLKAPDTEEWLSVLHKEAPGYRELYREPTHGFLLLAHAESSGNYRPPHDHGGGWVIYGVQRGETEIATYARVKGADGRAQLVKRETYVVRPGQCRAFLPGDIHDTRAGAGPVLLYRLTSCDFLAEEKEGRLRRYVQRDGVWTDPVSSAPRAVERHV